MAEGITTYRDLEKHLRDVYGADDFVVRKAEAQVRKLAASYGGDLRCFQELDFLDLGCGSRLTQDHKNSRRFEPWACRSVKALKGRRVAGVDIHSNDGESFEHYPWDLKNPVVLRAFPKNSFDLIHNNMFLPGPLADQRRRSPSLMTQLSVKRFETAALLAQHNVTDFSDALESLVQADLEDLRIAITQEVARLMRTTGIYLWDIGPEETQ